MLFHCEIVTRLPAHVGEDARRELLLAERRRGQELVEAGHIVQIWRVVGTFANISIWQADTPEELHRLLTSLPLASYQSVTVRPLVAHPLMGGSEGA